VAAASKNFGSQSRKICCFSKIFGRTFLLKGASEQMEICMEMASAGSSTRVTATPALRLIGPPLSVLPLLLRTLLLSMRTDTNDSLPFPDITARCHKMAAAASTSTSTAATACQKAHAMLYHTTPVYEGTKAVTCDGCGKTVPVTKGIWHCKACNIHDLCGVCFAKAHLQLQKIASEDTDATAKTIDVEEPVAKETDAKGPDSVDNAARTGAEAPATCDKAAAAAAIWWRAAPAAPNAPFKIPVTTKRVQTMRADGPVRRPMRG
jgi:hypothetical protein